MNCIACLLSAQCILVRIQITVSCFASIRTTSKFCYSHPISKLLLPKRNLFVCTEIPLYSPRLFDYIDGQYTVTDNSNGQFLHETWQLRLFYWGNDRIVNICIQYKATNLFTPCFNVVAKEIGLRCICPPPTPAPEAQLCLLQMEKMRFLM